MLVIVGEGSEEAVIKDVGSPEDRNQENVDEVEVHHKSDCEVQREQQLQSSLREHVSLAGSSQYAGGEGVLDEVEERVEEYLPDELYDEKGCEDREEEMFSLIAGLSLMVGTALSACQNTDCCPHERPG